MTWLTIILARYPGAVAVATTDGRIAERSRHDPAEPPMERVACPPADWDRHRCGPGCIPAPYDGPVLLGRRGETISGGGR